MSGTVGNDMSFERNAYKRKITDNVQQFVPCRFIWKTQLQVIEDTTFIHLHIFFSENACNAFHLFICNRFVYNNNSIIDITTLDEVMIDEIFEFMKKGKGSARSDFLVKIGNMFQCSMLGSQYRRIKID